MANPCVHIELQTRDLALAKDFYGKVVRLPACPSPHCFLGLCIVPNTAQHRLERRAHRVVIERGTRHALAVDVELHIGDRLGVGAASRWHVRCNPPR